MIDIENLELDLENPRIARILAMYKPDEIRSETIALALGAADTQEGDTYATYRNLKESIRTNRGVIYPIIVNKQNDGRMVVVEGNTRLQIYQQFDKEGVDGDWSKIPAIINDGMEEVEKNATRLQAHLVGPRPWDPYSKAKYLHTLSTEEHMTINLIVEYCGGKRKQVIDYIQAYNDMESYYRPALENDNDFDPTRFSVFVELQRSRVKTALVEGGYTKSDFAKWVIEGLFIPLETVRSLPNILQDTEAKDVFFQDGAKAARLFLNKVDEASAASLEKYSLIDLTHETIRRLAKIKHTDWMKMKSDPSNANRNALEELQWQLGDTLAGMGGEDDDDV